MSEVRSNLNEIAAYLRSLPGLLGLNRDGLGDELADIAGDRIHARFVQQAGSTGPFEANRGTYGERKRERGIPVGIGLHGDRIGGGTSRRENFTGRVETDSDRVSVFFGASDATRRRGMWFTSGTDGWGDQDIEKSGASNQPPRPFFELSEEDADAIADRLYDRLAQRLEQSTTHAMAGS